MSCGVIEAVANYIIQVVTLGLVLGIALKLSRWEHGRRP